MRESDFIRLGAQAAQIEARGGDCSRLLADGLQRIVGVEAAVGRWSLAAPTEGRSVVAGVPTISPAEYRYLVKYSPHHPRFRPDKLISTTPFRLSDEIRLSEFWNTEVWWYTHGIRGGRYPAGFSLGVHGGQAGMVGLHRADRDFSTDEIEYLDLLQEPLQSALRFRATLDRAVRRLSVLERADTVEECRSTPRERDVLALVATGRTNAVIGSLLGITERTVRKHLTNVYAKLEVPGRTSAAVWYRSATDSSARGAKFPAYRTTGRAISDERLRRSAVEDLLGRARTRGDRLHGPAGFLRCDDLVGSASTSPGAFRCFRCLARRRSRTPCRD
jgi:DNA-binding CsgD family transcriptional regulator